MNFYLKSENKSGLQRFIVNTGAQFSSSILSALASLLFTIYAARSLGPELYGRFSVVQIFITSFAPLLDFGLTNVIVREVAQKRGQVFTITSNILPLKAILGVLTFLLIVVCGYLIGYQFETWQLIVLYALSVIPNSVTSACVAIFNGHERMIYSTLSPIFILLGSIGGIIALSLGYGLYAVLGILVITSLMASVTNIFVLYFRFTKFGFQIDLSLWRSYILDAIPFGLIAIIFTFGQSAGPLMLSKISGEVAVGYYNLAFKIINIIFFFIGAYNTAIFPLFSRLESASLIKLNLSYRLSIKVMMIAGLTSVAVFTSISNKIIRFAFPAYEIVIPVLQLLSWFSLFSLLATVPINFLYAKGREREVTKIVLIATITSLFSNIFLIVKFGVMGLCVGMTIFAGVQFILSYKITNKIYYLNLVITAIRGLVVALPVYLVGIILNNVNLFIIIIFQGVMFILTLIILHVFDTEEREILMGLPLISHIYQLFKIKK